jgi:hypothetical protein
MYLLVSLRSSCEVEIHILKLPFPFFFYLVGSFYCLKTKSSKSLRKNRNTEKKKMARAHRISGITLNQACL